MAHGLIWRCPKCIYVASVDWAEPDPPIPTKEYKLRFSDPAKIALDADIAEHRKTHA